MSHSEPNGAVQDQGQAVEQWVRERYAQGANAVQPTLCCPVDYDPQYLEVIADEILEKDYGCGDPSQYVFEGETVLDLGSGGGKICYIASQRVGATGQVIGVDFNDAMLGLAEKYREEVGNRIGWHNVEFRKGRIQDLKLNLALLEEWMAAHDGNSTDGSDALEAEMQRLRDEEPLVADESVDVVVSNCVLNLVRPELKSQLFEEIFRVLKRGGRAVISDIVCDEDVPQRLQDDPELWSGCVSGAYREDAFLKAFEDVGFYGVKLEKYESQPWQTVEGIEFRSVTVIAYKGKEGPCLERNQAVIYNGPFSFVKDDDGHIYRRGERVAVCDKTFRILTRPPYSADFIPVEPLSPIPLEGAQPFDCGRTTRRDPRETKGRDYDVTTDVSDCCGTEEPCC